MRPSLFVAVLLMVGLAPTAHAGEAKTGKTPDEVLACSKSERLLEIAAMTTDTAASIKLMKRYVLSGECALLPAGQNYSVTEQHLTVTSIARIRLKGEPDQWWAVKDELQ